MTDEELLLVCRNMLCGYLRGFPSRDQIKGVIDMLDERLNLESKPIGE